MHSAALLWLWVLLGTALRFHHLLLKPLWSDECSTLVFSLGNSFQAIPLDHLLTIDQLLYPLQLVASTTSFDAVQRLLTESNHPPLYFAIAHTWLDASAAIGRQVSLGLSDITGSTDMASLGAARALSCLWGLLSIPLIYGVALCLWSRPSAAVQANESTQIRSKALALPVSTSGLTAHFSALLMALSPFGIYLAQEARHYTLTVLWILGSITCLVEVLRRWRDRCHIPLGLVCSWIIINGLGIATHYFFGLTLLAEFIVLMVGIALLQHLSDRPQQLRQNIWRLGAAILGTIASGAVWLPFLLSIQQGDELTRWVQVSTEGAGWLRPLLNTGASLVTMVYVLPIQGVSAAVAIASGLLLVTVTATMVAMAIAIVKHRTLVNGKARISVWLTDEYFPTAVLAGIVLSAVSIMLGVTYIFGMDISQAFRYHFVYFPAVILLVAWGLAQLWSAQRNTEPEAGWVKDDKTYPSQHVGKIDMSQHQGRTRGLVVLILLLSFAGGLTVNHNLAYQKVHRPDRIVENVLERYSTPLASHSDIPQTVPLIMAISHQSHGQTGRLMAIAWEMIRQVRGSQSPNLSTESMDDSDASSTSQALQNARFYLDHQPCERPGEQNCNAPSTELLQTLNQQPVPYELWLLNYAGQVNLKRQNCTYRKTKRVDGYKAQHYTCGLRE